MPAAVLVICAGVLWGVLVLGKRRQTAPKQGGPAAAVVTRKAAGITGIIRPQNFISIGTDLTGNIEAFMVEVGEDVFQDQVLARIGAGNLDIERQNATHALEAALAEVTRAESAVAAAQVEVSRAEADAMRSRIELDRVQKIADRQSTLIRAGATPRRVYEKAVADLEAATKDFEVMDKAARAARQNYQMAIDQVAAAKKRQTERAELLEQAEEAYHNAEIRSTVDGVLFARQGEVGKPASEAGPDMFQIATDIYALEVAVEPGAEQLKKVYPGQAVTVLVLDLPIAGIEGLVKEIKGNQVIVRFNSSTVAIRPGMRAEVLLNRTQ